MTHKMGDHSDDFNDTRPCDCDEPKTVKIGDRAIQLLKVVQPMVKQFAYEHNVGSNQKIAQSVATFLDSLNAELVEHCGWHPIEDWRNCANCLIRISPKV